jgi:hypothetical protein
MSQPVSRSYAPFESVCPSNACERCPVTAGIVADIGGIITNFDLRTQEGQVALDVVFAEKSSILSDSCLVILSQKLAEFSQITLTPPPVVTTETPTDLVVDTTERQETVSSQMEALLMVFFHDATCLGHHVKDNGDLSAQEAVQTIEERLTRTVKEPRPRDEGVQHRKKKPRFVKVEEKPGRIEI